MESLSSIVYKLMALFILFLFKNSAVSCDYVDNDPIPVPKHGTVSGYVCIYMAVLYVFFRRQRGAFKGLKPSD